MKAILVGYGEIGKGVRGFYERFHDIDVIDLNYTQDSYESEYDIMLVAIPYSSGFVGTIKEYQKRFKPKGTIIFSTVAIGTTSQIKNAVHAPIEGKHPHLEDSISLWKPMIGGYNKHVEKWFNAINKPRVYVENPEITEAMKMLSTSYYGVMLEYFRYANSVLEVFGGNKDHFNEYTNNYNNLYQEMDMANFTRPIFNSVPVGKLGGHCVTPNAKILDQQFPSIFLKQIYEGVLPSLKLEAKEDGDI